MAFLCLAGLASMPARALAQGDIALILAVEDYANYRKIENNLTHANAIGEQLKARSFDVTLVANPTNASARAALRDLNAKAANARIALIVMLGYGAAASGQTFFLPNNASIERATDLLSRGLSLGNAAQIIGSAQAGAVCFMMSAPTFAKPVDGVDLRPQLQVEPKSTVAVAVSNSNKIPVSRMDAAATQAARDVIGLLQSTPKADMAQFLGACASQQHGVISGTPADIVLAKAKVVPPPPAPTVAKTAPPPEQPPAGAPVVSDDAVQALQALEGMLDPRQIRRVQIKLATLGHYSGPIDAVIGPLTREGIRTYQKASGHKETGFLTPGELKVLVEGVP
jgi:hypothetical protein